jgi:hypothetical protein
MRKRTTRYYSADQVLWGLIILAVLVFLFMIVGRRLVW